MSAESRQTMILFLLALCVALLVLRDWQLQGEVELLHERLDGLGAARVEPVTARVARILGAQTDEAAEAAARENV